MMNGYKMATPNTLSLLKCLNGFDKTSLSSEEKCDTNETEHYRSPSAAVTTKKRADYLEWPEYFMAVAFLSAQRSKDPATQVGACIVNEEKKIVGVGYNGMPNGCSDDVLPWKKSGDWLDTKYPYVCHAELNAILNKNSSDVKNCTLYVALFPCNECAKLVVQSGIKEVVYMSDKHKEKPAFKASRRLLEWAGVKCSPFVAKRSKIVIDFECLDGTGQ